MINQTPKVSIIVPCFNSESFLQETLDSIFAQTYKNYEVILIDDGSTDHTPEIIRSLGNRVRSEFGPNCGAGCAREKGCKLARGEYFQYVDADDLLFPDAIEKRLEVLDANHGDIAYSDYQWLEKTDEGIFKPTTIRNRRIEDESADTQLALFDRWWRPLACLTYHRRIVEKISWSKILHIEDARYLFDACLAGARFVHVPGVRAYYRIHPEGASRDRLPWYRGVFERAHYIESTWKQNNALSEERSTALGSCYKEIADYSRERDRQLYNDAFERLFLLKPRNSAFRMMAHAIGYKNFEFLIGIRNRLLRPWHKSR